MTDEMPAPDLPDPSTPEPAESCDRCRKPADLCVCAMLTPLAARTRLLVLQHPQEQDIALGTARLLTGQVQGAVLRTGLSWPNLAKALGEPAENRDWAVLYLGAKDDMAKVPRGGMALLDRKGDPLPDQESALAGLKGVVLLDGTWSQAKTLWWRNAWLLKLRRLVIHPDFRSAYGSVRKEPRRESVSTLEAGAFVLARLEGDPALQARLLAPFDALLKRWRGRRGPRPSRQPSAPAG